MNAEMRFHKWKPDYTGLNVTELAYGVLPDCYGQEKAYWMDVITPENMVDQLRPVAFFIHGGGFQEPCDRKQSYISEFAKRLVVAGYTVIAPDYPVYGEHEKLDFAQISAEAEKRAGDAVHQAFLYVKSHSKELGIDCDRAVIFGGSAGGMTAFSEVKAHPDCWKVFVNLWGVSQNIKPDAAFPPVFSVHGTEDSLVSYELEKQVQNMLAEAGVPHKLYTIGGAGHTPVFCIDEYMPCILKFLEEYV